MVRQNGESRSDSQSGGFQNGAGVPGVDYELGGISPSADYLLSRVGSIKGQIVAGTIPYQGDSKRCQILT